MWMMLTMLWVKSNQGNCNIVKVIIFAGFWFGGKLAVTWYKFFHINPAKNLNEHGSTSMNFTYLHAKNPWELALFLIFQYYLNYCFHVSQTVWKESRVYFTLFTEYNVSILNIHTTMEIKRSVFRCYSNILACKSLQRGDSVVSGA